MAASKRLSVEDRPRRRAATMLAVVLVVGALHWALLGGWRWTWDAPPVAVPAMQVRTVAATAPGPAAAAGRPVVAAPRASPAAGSDRRRPAARPTSRRSAPVERRDAPGAAAVAGPAPPDSDTADAPPPPVYRTALPPSATLHFDVRRGLADGEAELRWRRDADGYALDAQIRVAGVAVLTQSSRGGVDAAGVAPLRFVDQRPSRPAAAVNFRRDLGRITFSRKAADAVLVPGTQDRLSWLLQLAAIVAAEPDLRQEGAEVRMAVAGAGGEVGDWRFRCQGEDTVETPAGAAVALRFLREPHGPYETRAEVWLDPAGGHFLPLRADWRTGAADDGFALRARTAPASAAE